MHYSQAMAGVTSYPLLCLWSVHRKRANSSGTASKESSSLSSHGRRPLSAAAPLPLQGREAFPEPSPLKLAGQAAAYLPSTHFSSSALYDGHDSRRDAPRSPIPVRERELGSSGPGNSGAVQAPVSQDANIQATLGHIAGQVCQGRAHPLHATSNEPLIHFIFCSWI